MKKILLGSVFGLALLVLMGVAYAYFHNFSSKQTIVAVIDSGVDYNHPDLKGKVIEGPDYVDGDSNPMDQYGHGTHVAGTIVKEEPHAKILAIRIADSKGNIVSGSTLPILYAIFHGANIVNMSYSQNYSRLTQWAIDFGYAKGVRFVAASGNQGLSTVDYPAAYDHVLAIGGYNDLTDGLYLNGNTGKKVTYIAPAVDVLSSDIVPQKYSEKTGTSMATAYASGVLAYLDYAKKNISSSNLLSKLKQLSHQISANRDYDLLDINKAYAETHSKKAYLWVRAPNKFSKSGHIHFSIESLNADKVEIYKNNSLFETIYGNINKQFNMTVPPGHYYFNVKAYKNGSNTNNWSFTEIVDHTAPIVAAQVVKTKGEMDLDVEVTEPNLESVSILSATAGQMTFNNFNPEVTQKLSIKINKGEFPISITAVDQSGNQAKQELTTP